MCLTAQTTGFPNFILVRNNCSCTKNNKKEDCQKEAVFFTSSGYSQKFQVGSPLGVELTKRRNVESKNGELFFLTKTKHPNKL